MGDGHTIYCGDSHCYLSSDLKLNHLFVIDPILLENELPPVEKNNKKIHFYPYYQYLVMKWITSKEKGL